MHAKKELRSWGGLTPEKNEMGFGIKPAAKASLRARNADSDGTNGDDSAFPLKIIEGQKMANYETTKRSYF